MKRPVLVSMQKLRRIQWICACVWLAMVVYTFASGDFRQNSTLRNAAEATLGALSLFMIWELWRTRDRAVIYSS